MLCPQCNSFQNEGSTVCTQCGAPLESSASNFSSSMNYDGNPYAPPQGGGAYDPRHQVDVPKLLKAQKSLSYAILFLILVIFTFFALVMIAAVIGGIFGANAAIEAQQQGVELDPIEIQQQAAKLPAVLMLGKVNTINQLIYLVLSVYALVVFCKTCLAAKFNTGLMVLLAVVVVFCPCVNLLPLILINVHAASLLRDRGIRLGWLGAKKADEVFQAWNSPGSEI